MRIRSAALPVLLSVVVACDGAAPPTPASIRVSPATVTLQSLGESQQLSAEVLDDQGNPIAGTFTFSWSSASPGVASVTSAGLVTAVGSGTSSITASAEGVSGSSSATVDQAAADLQIADGDGQMGEAGLPLNQDLVVTVFDGGGSPAVGKSVTFSVVEGGGSMSPATANTNTQGRASSRWTLGAAPGVPQRVRASIGGLTQEFTATAEEGLLRIQTTTLGNARLTLAYQGGLDGTGGDGNYTWSLASGSLPSGLSLASSGQITGTPTQQQTTSFTAQLQDGSGGSVNKALTLQVCEGPLQVGFGQIIESEAGSSTACGFFLAAGSSGDAYRMALVRLSESESGNTVGVTVDLTGFGVTADPVGPPLAAAFQDDTRSRFELTPELIEAIRVEERTEALHYRIRSAEERLVASLDRSALLPPSPTTGGGQLRAAFQQMDDPPATATLDVPGNFGSCTGGIPNQTTLRGFNDHLAIYETDNPTDPVDQALIDQLLDYYRDYGHQTVQDYFGGTTDINGDGRVTVLITPNVEDGTAAFVWSGDFFSQAQCQDSNAQEIVYYNPSIVNSMGDGNFQALTTMAHEVKHVSSLYNRVASASSVPFHPSFIEEGTAEIAGEITGRRSFAATGGPPVGGVVTANSFSGVTAENYGIFLRMARIVFYMSSQPNGVSASLTSRQGGIYGSGLAFHRWLGDAYGNAATTPFNDKSLFKMQNDSLTVAGTAAYPTLTNMSYTELLREYAQAVMMHGTGFETSKTYTTYDLSTATEIFSLPDPAGSYPWPVTLTCDGTVCPDDIDSSDIDNDDDRNVQVWAPFTTQSFNSPMGPGGIRVFEFQSNGTGSGVEILVNGTTQTKVYLSKIR